MVNENDKLSKLPSLDDLIAPDGTIKGVAGAKPKRRGRRTATGLPTELTELPDDEIQRLLADPVASKPTTLAHEGHSEAGHTEQDKPSTQTDDSGSW